MANEITLTARLAASKSSTSVSNATSSFSVDMNGAQMYHANPTVTTAAALSVAPVSQGSTNMADRYWLFIRNQETADELHISFDGGTTYSCVVLPGESFGPVLVRHGRSLYAKAINPTGGGAAYPTESTTAGSVVCEIVAVES